MLRPRVQFKRDKKNYYWGAKPFTVKRNIILFKKNKN